MHKFTERLSVNYDEQTLRQATAYEEAIHATGIGCFNVVVLLLLFCGVLAIIFASTTLSLIIPNADCYMHLTQQDKGYLNSITYLGMLMSVVLWAAISDYSGRKNVLISTHLLSAFFVLAASMSSALWQLLLCKFFDGFCVSGGFSALLTYISEVHSNRYRQRIMYVSGVMLSVAAVLLPAIAGGILPFKFAWDLRFMYYRSWNLFLAVSALPSLLCGLVSMLLPESPKFMYSKPDWVAAAQILKRIHALNTRGKKGAYPIDVRPLDDEEVQKPPKTLKATLLAIVRQMRQLCSKDVIWLALCVVSIDFFVLLCQNTIRLWLPEIFARYAAHAKAAGDSSSTAFCTIMEERVSKAAAPPKQCYYVMTTRAYLNIFWVNSASILSYIFTFVVITYIGAKIVLSTSLLISSISGIGLYFANSQTTTAVCLSIYLAMENIASTSLVFACTALFPTKIRNSVLAILFFFGRVGGVIGNLTFHFFLGQNCLLPISTFAAGPFVAFVISILLPNPSTTPFA